MIKMHEVSTYVSDTNSLVTIKDSNYIWQYVSQPIADLFGFRHPDEMIGLRDEQITTEATAKQYRLHDQIALKNGYWMGIEPGPEINHQPTKAYVSKTALIDEDNEVSGLLIVGFMLENLRADKFANVLADSTKYYGNHAATSQYQFSDFDSNLKLTTREQQCLFYVIRHKTSREIADIFNISRRTVESYIARIKNKLGCHSRAQLIEKAEVLNLVPMVPTGLVHSKTEQVLAEN